MAIFSQKCKRCREENFMNEGPIYMKILLIGAWFIQMGAHEGAHAHMAYRCGDDTSSVLGKRSFNPLNHVEWTNINSILFSVVVPSLTAYYYMFPMGMAWVPVNVRRLKNPGKDMAKISFVGPLANLVVAAICLIVHFMFSPLGLTGEEVGGMRFVWLCDQFLFQNLRHLTSRQTQRRDSDINFEFC